ncbi:multicopper oxidase [Pseudomonas syringae]|uniref:Multicopper oxidase n=1 Tax=Pseudomonas syringae TaxID=317 RepID=A0A085V7T5_PSESX|nr:multicopper oxidase [Pseudomonas syringae]
MQPRKSRGAWLSLFAMLMIFIGPLVSQAVPMDQHAGMSMSMDMPMLAASMDMPADHGTHHQAAPKTEQASVDHVLWAKCGYCTLLFSCPAITSALAVTALAPPNPADFYHASIQSGHAQRSIFPNARSRAPPLFVTR